VNSWNLYETPDVCCCFVTRFAHWISDYNQLKMNKALCFSKDTYSSSSSDDDSDTSFCSLAAGISVSVCVCVCVSSMCVWQHSSPIFLTHLQNNKLLWEGLRCNFCYLFSFTLLLLISNYNIALCRMRNHAK